MKYELKRLRVMEMANLIPVRWGGELWIDGVKAAKLRGESDEYYFEWVSAASDEAPARRFIMDEFASQLDDWQTFGLALNGCYVWKYVPRGRPVASRLMDLYPDGSSGHEDEVAQRWGVMELYYQPPGEVDSIWVTEYDFDGNFVRKRKCGVRKRKYDWIVKQSGLPTRDGKWR